MSLSSQWEGTKKQGNKKSALCHPHLYERNLLVAPVSQSLIVYWNVDKIGFGPYMLVESVCKASFVTWWSQSIHYNPSTKTQRHGFIATKNGYQVLPSSYIMYNKNYWCHYKVVFPRYHHQERKATTAKFSIMVLGREYFSLKFSRTWANTCVDHRFSSSRFWLLRLTSGRNETKLFIWRARSYIR